MAYLAGGLFVVLAFYMTIDTLGRKFLSLSSGFMEEISGYALAMGGLWGLAYAQKRGAHVRFDLVLPYLPPHLRRALDYINTLWTGILSLILTYFTFNLALQSLENMKRSTGVLGTPLFVPQFLVVAGFAMLTIQVVAIAVSRRVEASEPPPG